MTIILKDTALNKNKITYIMYLGTTSYQGQPIGQPHFVKKRKCRRTRHLRGLLVVPPGLEPGTP